MMLPGCSHKTCSPPAAVNWSGRPSCSSGSGHCILSLPRARRVGLQRAREEIEDASEPVGRVLPRDFGRPLG